MATTNKILVGLGTFGAVAVIAFASSAAVLADDKNGQNGLAQRIATKFNLNQEEVQAEFKAYGQERKEQRLNDAVKAGTITEEQKQLLIAKHEENREGREQNRDLTAEERKAKREENRAAMQAWAEENGIDLEALHEGRGDRGPGGRGHGGPSLQ